MKRRYYNFATNRLCILITCLISFVVTAAQAPPHERIILTDSFTGVERFMPDGTKKLYPDTTKWAFSFWPGVRWPDSYGNGTNWLESNGECQTYVTPFFGKIKGTVIPVKLRYDPFSIEKDGLHIKASVLNEEQKKAYQVGGARRFGSGILISRQSFTYGTIKMVAKLPSAKGSWPALWLLSEDHQWPPEIDIIEAMAWGARSKQIHSGLLTPKAENQSFAKWFNVDVDPSKDFHEYKLDWNKDRISMYFDGKELWTHPTPASMHKNMYLLMNLAVGGKWSFNELGIGPIDSVDPARLSKGADAIQSSYPAEMIVKSISVTQP